MIDSIYAAGDCARQLGTRLRQRRRALGLTQQEVAELAGTTQRLVSLIESGKPTVRFDKLAAVAEALGMIVSLVPHDATGDPVQPAGGNDG